jgi:hypothetical protein
MDEFNNDPNVLIFILSTRAGGLGINLVSADTVRHPYIPPREVAPRGRAAQRRALWLAPVSEWLMADG